MLSLHIKENEWREKVFLFLSYTDRVTCRRALLLLINNCSCIVVTILNKPMYCREKKRRKKKKNRSTIRNTGNAQYLKEDDPKKC